LQNKPTSRIIQNRDNPKVINALARIRLHSSRSDQILPELPRYVESEQKSPMYIAFGMGLISDEE
jgi:hypothetical protein